MKAVVNLKNESTVIPDPKEIKSFPAKKKETTEAFDELKRGVYAALETYSNVHRGSGQFSTVSTHLFEHAREIVLEYLGLNKDKYVVIFCSARRAEMLKAKLKPESFICVSSRHIGLYLSVTALAVDRKALPKGSPVQPGGGTVKHVSAGWVLWADVPDKFEAGTPAIINIIAFAKALLMIKQLGKSIFIDITAEKKSAAEILYRDELEKHSGREMLIELRKTLIGRAVHVPTVEGFMPYVNLDNGASTPTFSPIWDAVCQTWQQTKQVQQEVISEVKSICAEVLGAPLSSYDMIFTSNTTEAINLVAESLSKESKIDFDPVILNTVLEHTSNELPWRIHAGFKLIRLPVDDEGFVDLIKLESLLSAYNSKGKFKKKRIRLVTVTGASNVLGTFNDLAEISRITHKYGAELMVDAAQLIAHRKIDMESLGIDYLACSAHKVYAPFGTGLLVAGKGKLKFSSTEFRQIKTSGEENAGGIAALGKALVLLQRIGFQLIEEEEHVLTRQALQGLAKIPGIKIYGTSNPDSPRLALKGAVITFCLKNMPHNLLARQLADQSGIGVRTGCHCAHLLVKRLLNIGSLHALMFDLGLILFPQFTGNRLPGLVRMSLGIGNCEEDVDKLVYKLSKIAEQCHTGLDNQTMVPGTNLQKEMDDFITTSVRRVYSTLVK